MQYEIFNREISLLATRVLRISELSLYVHTAGGVASLEDGCCCHLKTDIYSKYCITNQTESGCMSATTIQISSIMQRTPELSAQT